MKMGTPPRDATASTSSRHWYLEGTWGRGQWVKQDRASAGAIGRAAEGVRTQTGPLQGSHGVYLRGSWGSGAQGQAVLCQQLPILAAGLEAQSREDRGQATMRPPLYPRFSVTQLGPMLAVMGSAKATERRLG